MSLNSDFRLRCFQLLFGISVMIWEHQETQSGEESSSSNMYVVVYTGECSIILYFQHIFHNRFNTVVNS